MGCTFTQGKTLIWQKTGNLRLKYVTCFMAAWPQSLNFLYGPDRINLHIISTPSQLSVSPHPWNLFPPCTCAEANLHPPTCLFPFLYFSRQYLLTLQLWLSRANYLNQNKHQPVHREEGKKTIWYSNRLRVPFWTEVAFRHVSSCEETLLKLVLWPSWIELSHWNVSETFHPLDRYLLQARHIFMRNNRWGHYWLQFWLTMSGNAMRLKETKTSKTTKWLQKMWGIFECFLNRVLKVFFLFESSLYFASFLFIPTGLLTGKDSMLEAVWVSVAKIIRLEMLILGRVQCFSVTLPAVVTTTGCREQQRIAWR